MAIDSIVNTGVQLYFKPSRGKYKKGRDTASDVCFVTFSLQYLR